MLPGQPGWKEFMAREEARGREYQAHLRANPHLKPKKGTQGRGVVACKPIVCQPVKPVKALREYNPENGMAWGDVLEMIGSLGKGRPTF